MMNIDYIEIQKYSIKPTLYEKGNAMMWTHPHIQPYLLEAHLNPKINAASRTIDQIEKTVCWMKSLFPKGKTLDVLDLGCGPGLYIEHFYHPNQNVIGIDFNVCSLEYAKNHTKGVTYIQKNYLELDLNQTFDLIYMIYCDFGVLTLREQHQLLSIVEKHLKPDGLFVMDGYNHHFKKHIKEERTWDLELSGFWSDKPYLVLNETFIYPEENAFLEQHIVFEDGIKPQVYRFYNRIFNLNDMQSIFTHQFSDIQHYQNVIDDKCVDFYVFKR